MDDVVDGCYSSGGCLLWVVVFVVVGGCGE